MTVCISEMQGLPVYSGWGLRFGHCAVAQRHPDFLYRKTQVPKKDVTKKLTFTTEPEVHTIFYLEHSTASQTLTKTN